MAALFFAVLYIHRVYQHNKREAIPDAQRYLQSALYTSFEGNLGSVPVQDDKKMGAYPGDLNQKQEAS